MVGDPGDHRALDGHRAQGREEVLEALRGLEGAMGEEAMEADGYPDRRDEVHRGADREVGGADQVVPEQGDPGQRRGERQDDSAEVDGLLGPAHLLHVETVRYVYK